MTGRGAPARRPHARRGFALLVVLWFLVALGALGLELALVSRQHRLAALNTVELTRARAAAESGVARARARLSRLASGIVGSGERLGADRLLDPWADAARFLADTLVLGDARAAVRVRDAGAALNVNLASPEELQRLFSALDVDAGQADRIAQAIADWRDPDDAHRARGAERDLYLRLGAPMLPPNGPIRSLAELRYVRGMTDAAYARALPHLTLRGTGRINLNAADRPVLLTLPGVTERVAAVLLSLRRAHRRVLDLNDVARALPSGVRERFADSFPALAARTTLDARELELTSTGWAGDGRVRARAEALLVRAGGPADGSANGGAGDGATYVVWRRVE